MKRAAQKTASHSAPSAHMLQRGVANQNSAIGGSPSANHMTSSSPSAIWSVCTDSENKDISKCQVSFEKKVPSSAASAQTT